MLPAAQNELQAGFRHYDEIDQRVADDFYSNFILLCDQAKGAPGLRPRCIEFGGMRSGE